MRKKEKLLCLFFVLLIGASSCTDNLNSPGLAPRSPVSSSSNSSLNPSISPRIQSAGSSSIEASDISGTIHVKYFWNSTGPAKYNTLSVPVDPNYVIVGGGAVAFYGSGVGAMLISSRPDYSNDAWVGSSGDHLQADAHYLWVSAIGLRIDGISASQLKSYMTLTQTTASVAPGPSTTGWQSREA